MEKIKRKKLKLLTYIFQLKKLNNKIGDILKQKYNNLNFIFYFVYKS